MRHAGMNTFDEYGKPAFGVFCFFGVAFSTIASLLWAFGGDDSIQGVWMMSLAPFVATPGLIGYLVVIDVVVYTYERMDDYLPRWLTKKVW